MTQHAASNHTWASGLHSAMQHGVSFVSCVSLSHCLIVCSYETTAAADPEPGRAPGFKWPWQSRAKPGGAVRQKQPGKDLDQNPGNNSGNNLGMTSGKAPASQSGSTQPQMSSWQSRSFQAWTGNGVAGGQDKQPNATDHSGSVQYPDASHQPEVTADRTAGPEGVSVQASGLAEKAVGRIAAAQHAISSSSLHSNRPGSASPKRCDAIGLSLSPSKKSGSGTSPVSPRGGAFSVPSSPQHNSRLRTGGATSAKLKQLISEANAQRQLSGRDSELAQGTGQGNTAGPSPDPSEARQDSSAGQGSSAQPQGRGVGVGQGNLAQPQFSRRGDTAEGREHADNPGSQAAALDRAEDSSKDTHQAHRYRQSNITCLLSAPHGWHTAGRLS